MSETCTHKPHGQASSPRPCSQGLCLLPEPSPAHLRAFATPMAIFSAAGVSHLGLCTVTGSCTADLGLPWPPLASRASTSWRGELGLQHDASRHLWSGRDGKEAGRQIWLGFLSCPLRAWPCSYPLREVHEEVTTSTQYLTSQGLRSDSYELRLICWGVGWGWKLSLPPSQPSPLGEALGLGLVTSCSLWTLLSRSGLAVEPEGPTTGTSISTSTALT